MNRAQRRQAERDKAAFVAKMLLGKQMKRLVVKKPPVLPNAQSLALVAKWRAQYRPTGNSHA